MAGVVTSVGAVGELFSCLEHLQKLSSNNEQGGFQEACTNVMRSAETVVEWLDYRTREYYTARTDADIFSDHLRQSIQNLIKVKKETSRLQEEKKFASEMKLAEAGVDPRPIELPANLQSRSGVIGGMRHSSSYESFKQQKMQSSSPGSVRSGASTPQSGFGIRKARSDPDVNLHSMQKDVEALKVNNRRLKDSEKKLLKETLQLGRKCKALEEEKDRAEDRLKIEQTQRDSTEKLRQRNRELEQQVQKLKQQYEVIKEKGGDKE